MQPQCGADHLRPQHVVCVGHGIHAERPGFAGKPQKAADPLVPSFRIERKQLHAQAVEERPESSRVATVIRRSG